LVLAGEYGPASRLAPPGSGGSSQAGGTRGSRPPGPRSGSVLGTRRSHVIMIPRSAVEGQKVNSRKADEISRSTTNPRPSHLPGDHPRVTSCSIKHRGSIPPSLNLSPISSSISRCPRSSRTEAEDWVDLKCLQEGHGVPTKSAAHPHIPLADPSIPAPIGLPR
jgi:hypothetical protein